MNIEDNKNNAVDSAFVLELFTVASEFCLFIEKLEKCDKNQILEYFRKISPVLYVKGELLPEIQVSDESANERFVTEEDYEIIFNDLRTKLFEEDTFYYINPADKNDFSPVKASLSEFFSDIYQDLKDFLLLYQKNTLAAKENAVSECRYLFTSHWGFRLVNVLQYLHNIKYDPNELDLDRLLDEPQF